MKSKLTKIMPWSSSCRTAKTIFDIAIVNNSGKVKIKFSESVYKSQFLLQLTEHDLLALSMVNNVKDLEPWMIEESIEAKGGIKWARNGSHSR